MSLTLKLIENGTKYVCPHTILLTRDPLDKFGGQWAIPSTQLPLIRAFGGYETEGGLISSDGTVFSIGMRGFKTVIANCEGARIKYHVIGS